MAKKGSKNNVNNRGASAKLKSLNGKTVVPIKFLDISSKKNIIAAKYEDNGDLVTDGNGNPIPYDKI